MPLVDQDQEHLRLLSIVYYIYAGMTAFFGMFGGLYGVIGLVFAMNPPPTTGQGDPKIIGYVFTALGAVFLLLAAAITIAEILAARYLKGRHHHTFCLIVACFNCLWIHIGTALGICTIVVLQRPGVKELFQVSAPSSPPQLPMSTL